MCLNMVTLTELVPIVATLTTIALGTCAINARQPNRPRFFAALMLTASVAFHTSANLPVKIQLVDVFLIASVFYITHLVNVLFIKKFRVESPFNPGETIWTFYRLRKAYYIGANVRWLNTSLEVRGIAGRPLNQNLLKKWEDTKEPEHKPFITSSRIHFILRKIMDLVLYHYLEILLNETFHPKFYARDFAYSKTHFLSRLFFQPNNLHPYKPNSREVMVRGYYTVSFFLGDYLMLHKVHSLFALVFVGSGIDKPEDWPKLFGSFMGMTKGVRGMWGSYWHKLHTRSYCEISLALLSNIGITRDHTYFRLLSNLLVFCITGVVHVLVSRRLGYTCGGWVEIFWWFGNWSALVSEALVARWYKNFWRRMEWKRNERFEMAVGALWALAWIFWSVPKVVFKKQWCAPGHW